MGTAQYVAGYALKKINGPKAQDHYLKYDSKGQLQPVNPEFVLMSRGTKETKGIGYGWYKQFKNDLQKDFLTIDGKKHPIPRYYEKLTKQHGSLDDETTLELNKEKRRETTNHEERTRERLDTKHQAIKHRMKRKNDNSGLRDIWLSRQYV